MRMLIRSPGSVVIPSGRKGQRFFNVVFSIMSVFSVNFLMRPGSRSSPKLDMAYILFVYKNIIGYYGTKNSVLLRNNTIEQ